MFQCNDLANKKARIAFLITVFFSNLVAIASQLVYANALPVSDSIAVQDVYPEQIFVHRIMTSDADGEPPIIRMLNAPKGATLSANSDGSRDFIWKIPHELASKIVIIFQSHDAKDTSLIVTRRMVLRKVPSAPTDSSAQSPPSQQIASTIVKPHTATDDTNVAKSVANNLIITAKEALEPVEFRNASAKNAASEKAAKDKVTIDKTDLRKAALEEAKLNAVVLDEAVVEKVAFRLSTTEIA